MDRLERESAFHHLPVLRAWLPFGIVALLIPLIAGLTFSAYILTEGQTSQNFHHVFYLFDVGREYNIPTWYSSMLWALLGLLAFVIGSQARRFRVSWTLLGVVGLAASIDEYQELHERLDAFGIPRLPSLPFAVPFPWLVIGVPLAVVVGLLLLPLVLSLPRRTMLGILAAGAIFLSGAVGVETASGFMLMGNDWLVDWRFVLVTLVEETLEMLGVSLAVGSLLSLFERDRTTGTWRVVRLAKRERKRRGDRTGPDRVAPVPA